MSLKELGLVTVKELAEQHGLNYFTLLKRIHKRKIELTRLGTMILIRADLANEAVTQQAGDDQ